MPQSKPAKGQHPVLLSIGAQTREAVATLLAIVQNIGPYVVTRTEDDPLVGKTSITKEAGIAAEVTFMNACSQLDVIIKESTRWSNAGEHRIETALAVLHEEHAKHVATHAEAMARSTRPSILLRPTTVQLPSGLWVCAYSSERGSLQGMGRSPHEAHKDFDDRYFQLTSNKSVEELVEEANTAARAAYEAEKQAQPKRRKPRRKQK